jgi:hypothetical protein
MSSSHKTATSKNSSKSKQAAAAAALPNDFIDVDAEGDVEEEDQLMMNNQPTSSSAATTHGYGTKRVKRDYQVCACSNLTSKNLKIKWWCWLKSTGHTTVLHIFTLPTFTYMSHQWFAAPH